MRFESLSPLPVIAAALIGCGAGVHHDSSSSAVEPPLALESFAFSDAAVWSIAVDGGEPALELTRNSEYEPPYRSPHSIALLRDPIFGDFTLEVELKQTGPEYAHRDLCVIFAFESTTRFGYVHLASKPDANAHNVFIVDHAARRNLMPPRPADRGVEWGTDAWHRVKIERAIANAPAREGRVRVYFDDMATPLFESSDGGLGIGRVGLGSFDDTGRFRRIRIAGDSRTPTSDAPFSGSVR